METRSTWVKGGISLLEPMALCLVWATLSWASLAWAQPPGQAPAEPWVAVGRILTETSQDMDKRNVLLKERLTREKEGRAALKNTTNELEAAASAQKASLAMGKMPLPQAADLLREYALGREKISERLKVLQQEIDKSTQIRTQALQARDDFQTQVEHLKKMELPPEAHHSLAARYQSYQEKATAVSDLGAQLLKVLEEEREQTLRQQTLTTELVTSLETYIEKSAKRQLFSRQPTSALRVPVSKLVAELAGIPASAARRIRGAVLQTDWRGFLQANLASLFGLFAFGGLLVYGWRRQRRLWGHWLARWAEAATYFTQKISLALAASAVRNSWLVLGIVWLGLGLRVLNLFDNVPGQVLFYGLVYWLVFRLLRDLLGALFAPGAPGQGIVPLDKVTARFYDRYLVAFCAYLFFVQWGVNALEWLQYPTDLLIFLEFICLMVTLLWFAWLLRKPFLDNLLAGAGLAPDAWGARLMRGLRLLILPVLGAILVSDLLGFQMLSLYLSSGTANTVLAALTFWFLGHIGKDFSAYFTHPEEGLLARKLDLEAERLTRPHLLLPKIINGVIFIGVVLGVLLFWGVPLAYYRKMFQVLSQGPDLGPAKLTPLAVILAVASIYLARTLSHLSRFLLERRLFTRTVWNVAAQQTIATAVNYGLMTLGVVMALSFLGVNLTNLVLIAGALGVGIGFGLQNIVNNFVSGLIILFERPIKVGDLLSIDGQWGEVKAIRVRSTVFETRDHCVLIIPNSDLLSSKIQNWTHFGSGPFRLSLKVWVAYGSDVDEVSGLIDRVCRENPRALHHPAPQIIFNTFGDSALEFTFRVHLRTPDDREQATHELNTAVYRALQAAGIEIPFPQREFRLTGFPEAPDNLLPKGKPTGPKSRQ